MSNTSKIIENILNSIITGIISFLLPIVIPCICSIIIGFSYKVSIIEVISNIPLYVYLILFLPFMLWVIRKYINKKMNEGILGIVVFTYEGYEDIGEIEYNDLIWVVQVKSRILRDAQFYGNEYWTFNKLINNIQLNSSPRCSKCGAELYFTRHDLWYTYDCVNQGCSFIKRTWQSKDKMKDIAKKQYKYKVEMEFYEKMGE